MSFVSFRDNQPFYELEELAADPEIVALVRDCVQAQKDAAIEARGSRFKPAADALEHVSPETLEKILRSQQDVNGIRTDRTISNVIVFNDKRYQDGVFDKSLSFKRDRLNKAVESRMRGLFGNDPRLYVASSGFFLYPKQGYMGWHTNSQTPGWRLYINYVEEPGRSFIRYRDPRDGRITTCMDKGLNFRLFRIRAEEPLWHAVYSDTDRYSLGYRITKPVHWWGYLRNRFARTLRAFR